MTFILYCKLSCRSYTETTLSLAAIQTTRKEVAARVSQNSKLHVAIEYNRVQEMDVVEVWKLVKDDETLELNSAYCYLMFSRFFPDTFIVAKAENKVIGFVIGFVEPISQDSLFVWQIGVSQRYRGMGIATELLQSLMQKGNSEMDVRMLEATVAPSNEPSISLFKRFAAKHHVPCIVSKGFDDAVFPPGSDHEPEDIIRLGPFGQPFRK